MRTRYNQTGFYRTIGCFLRDARVRQCVSINDLASRTGIAPEQINAYELGDAHITVYDMVNIADVLGGSVAPLFENGQSRVPVPMLDFHYLNETLTALGMALTEIKENMSL